MIIYRYIAYQVLIGFIISTAVLLPLFSFFDLLDQLDDVGRGTYRVIDAFTYTAMLLPRRFIQIAPFVALLGTVIALGKLAVNSELIALRVAGLSPLRISFAPFDHWCFITDERCHSGAIHSATTATKSHYLSGSCIGKKRRARQGPGNLDTQ
jgi:lipopolysaccharide export LptBFGC system permease protein LptF